MVKPKAAQSEDPTPGAPAHFARALDALVAKIRADRSVLAVVLCGSLAHDTVWSRSDIDLVLVTIDDKLVPASSMALDADGVNVHALMLPRASFKRLADGALSNSFMHSMLSKGRLLYAHDESIAPVLERMRVIGGRDTQIQMLAAATEALSCLYKARKWFLTRGDYDYTAVWILAAATPIARMEVMRHGQLSDREVLPRALPLNPALFSVIYTGLLNNPKHRDAVEQALTMAETHLLQLAPQFAAPVVAWLSEVHEARSCTEIDAHFARTMGIEHVSGACEYLADQGVIGRASVTSRLTKKSTADVQEIAFYALTPPPDVY
jgi:hypothetical protein